MTTSKFQKSIKRAVKEIIYISFSYTLILILIKILEKDTNNAIHIIGILLITKIVAILFYSRTLYIQKKMVFLRIATAFLLYLFLFTSILVVSQKSTYSLLVIMLSVKVVKDFFEFIIGQRNLEKGIQKGLIRSKGEILGSIIWSLRILLGRVFYYNIKSKIIKRTCVSTSNFFRDFIDYEKKIPEFYDQTKSPLKILSVGCADGQEPYSIAVFCIANKIPCEIIGVDVSEKAVNNANNARYNLSAELEMMKHNNSFDWTKKYKDYFVFKGDDFYPNEKVRSMVKFFNMGASEITIQDKFHFVFARKMLYYIPKRDREKVVFILKKSLIKGLNFKEHIIMDSSTFKRLPEIQNYLR